MPILRRQDGQATVEFLALLPLVALVAGALWQCVLAGRTYAAAGGAARAAARAAALGDPPLPVARGVLPPALRPGAQAERVGSDGVRVRVRVPAIIGPGPLATIAVSARFESQEVAE